MHILVSNRVKDAMEKPATQLLHLFHGEYTRSHGADATVMKNQKDALYLSKIGIQPSEIRIIAIPFNPYGIHSYTRPRLGLRP